MSRVFFICPSSVDIAINALQNWQRICESSAFQYVYESMKRDLPHSRHITNGTVFTSLEDRSFLVL
jgi:hypothetical protein